MRRTVLCKGVKVTGNAVTISAIMVLMGVLTLGGTSVSFGYEETTVTSGGVIQGKVTLKGGLPAARIFRLVLYPFGTFCKKISDEKGNFHLQEFVISEDLGLQDVVVVVEGINAGKPFPEISGDSRAVDCQFEPVVSVLKNPQSIRVLNQDPIIHNIQVYQYGKGNIIFNESLSLGATQEGILRFDPEQKISQWICGMHEFMQKWGYIVDNPYHSITGEGGGYLIDDIPPGTYTVKAWHAHTKTISKQVTVPANGKITLDFEFESSSVRRPLYELQESGRIGNEARVKGDKIGSDP